MNLMHLRKISVESFPVISPISHPQRSGKLAFEYACEVVLQVFGETFASLVQTKRCSITTVV